jgi:hypothetical protein
MEISPAGTAMESSGHHHLLLNLDDEPDMQVPLPASEQVIHFGKGQTEVELELPAGQYTLQLLLGNYLHVPHDPPVMSEQITVVVE